MGQPACLGEAGHIPRDKHCRVCYYCWFATSISRPLRRSKLSRPYNYRASQDHQDSPIIARLETVKHLCIANRIQSKVPNTYVAIDEPLQKEQQTFIPNNAYPQSNPDSSALALNLAASKVATPLWHSTRRPEVWTTSVEGQPIEI